MSLKAPRGFFSELELKQIPKNQRLIEVGGLRGVSTENNNKIRIRWYYQFRSPVSKKLREISCGIYPDNTMSSIRRLRDSYRLIIAQGIDPIEDKRLKTNYKVEQSKLEVENSRILTIEARKRVLAEKEKERLAQEAKLSVNQLFEEWVKYGVRRKDGNKEIIRVFNKDVLPKLGKKTISEVTENNIRKLLENIISRGANRIAVQVHSLLNQMFMWAEKRKPWRRLLSDGNPVVLVEVDKLLPSDYDLNNIRDRVLSGDEIKELRDKFAELEISYLNSSNRRENIRPIQSTLQCAVWICLSTLCRIGALTKARWQEIDFEKRTWFIPAVNDKGGGKTNLDNTVYLSDFALEWFQNLYEITGNTQWCFPATNHDGALDAKTIGKQISDRQIMFSQRQQQFKSRTHNDTLVLSGGINGKWTMHDLRRTGSTMMQELGIEIVVINLCQSHIVLDKVNRHYLHGKLETDK